MPTISIEFTDGQWELIKQFYPKNVIVPAPAEWTVELLASVYKQRITDEIQSQRRLKAAEEAAKQAFE